MNQLRLLHSTSDLESSINNFGLSHDVRFRLRSKGNIPASAIFLKLMQVFKKKLFFQKEKMLTISGQSTWNLGQSVHCLCCQLLYRLIYFLVMDLKLFGPVYLVPSRLPYMRVAKVQESHGCVCLYRNLSSVSSRYLGL